MSDRTFALPDLGEGLTEAEVVRWLVVEGDRVRVDQPVVEVETAKATVEVPTPFAGTVTTLHAGAGQVVAVGAPLLSVAAAESRPDGPAPLAGAAPAGAAPEGAAPEGAGKPDAAGQPGGALYREEERAGSGNVLIGYGTGATTGPRRHRRPRSRRSPSGVPGARGGSGAPGGSGTAGAREGSAGAGARFGSGTGAGLGTGAMAVVADPPRRPRVVSPLVRRLAQEWGVDVRTVRGSGHAGLILRRDVERAAAAAAGASGARPVPPAAPPPAAPVPTPVPTPLPALGEQREALSGFRKAAAAVFERSRREIPEVTIWVDVDATPLVTLREAARTADHPGPGLLAYLARFTVAALREYPVFNSRYDAQRQEIVRLPSIDLGVAVQGARGLVVPAVRAAETLSTTGLDAEIRRVTAAARAGTATPGELSAGTFTLNNYGAFRVDGSAAIINPPQVAMLGVGRIVDRPWVVDGAVVVRKVVALSFVFDHRVCDGATAAGFLRRIADAVEDPAAAVAHL